ncbi:helix-turn-helix transcriptional regulator [Roseateles sp.]|uniref:helix-turn-helix domain-containing protein n=1 Tax=Roseateles sp. TaxID=1971397 RepID=UPI003263246B
MPEAGIAAGEVWPKRLKEARVALGLSQKQLGIESGLDEFVASTRINRYELGVHAPDFQMSMRLARVLQVPVAYLYCDSDDMAQLILAFHRASKAARKHAMAALQGPV